MIDLLEIKIQFDASLVEAIDDRHSLVNVDFSELDIPMGSKSVHWRDDGTIGTSGLYHPYESLKTSFTGMAMKVNFDGYFYPHVVIKASPAKILQGHNVFGSDNLELCATEMLYWLQEAYPTLYGMLSITTAQVVKMDITYSSIVSSPKLVRAAIDYMSRVSNGQTKPTKSKKYETTVYWGGATSRLIRQKCYSKIDEYMQQLDAYKKQAKAGDSHALAIVNAMSDERVIALARTSMRWECTFMSRWLERNDIPTNLWSMINHQKENPTFLHDIWTKGFSKIFEAMRGQDMTINNDDKVLQRLKADYQKVNERTGKISYRKAINLYSFYIQLRSIGYQEMKAQKLYSVSRFNELISDLVASGFSKAFLQNIHIEADNEKINFLNIINVDFGKQYPVWYKEPLSTPQRLLLNRNI